MLQSFTQIYVSILLSFKLFTVNLLMLRKFSIQIQSKNVVVSRQILLNARS